MSTTLPTPSTPPTPPQRSDGEVSFWSKCDAFVQYIYDLGIYLASFVSAMWATLWLSECWRLAKPGAPALVFSDWRQLPAMTDAVQAAGFEWRGIVVWHKPNARPMTSGSR